MNYSEYLKPETWRILLGNDFNRGFFAALVLILLLLLLLLFIRLTLGMIFRRHRTGKIIIQRADGDTQVSLSALSALVRNELNDYPAIECSRILLYKQGKKYSLSLFCDYSLKDQSGIPAFCDEFKPKVLNALNDTFGIKDIREIKLCIDEVTDESDLNEKTAPPVTPDVNTGF